jgi:hypothetical protein
MARRGRGRLRSAVVSCSQWAAARVAGRSSRWFAAEQRTGVVGNHRRIMQRHRWFGFGNTAYAGAQTPSVATAQSGQTMHVYVTHSNQGTWLFPPNQNQGGNN